jgi:membrane-bound serine protease (ClpP class)
MWDLPISALLGAIVAGKIIAFFLLWQAWRIYRQGRRQSPSRMLGLQGQALTDIAGEGRVMVQGEYWWAHARAPIAAGGKVRVTGLDGMWLEVEPLPDKTLVPRPVSAVVPSETDYQ